MKDIYADAFAPSNNEPFGDLKPFDIRPYKEGIKAALFAHQELTNARAEAAQRSIAGVSKGSTRFTTNAMIDYCRSLGWKLMDRERYDYRTKRMHDTFMGADAMFETDTGITLVQAAGRYERATHYARFIDLGGVERATRRSWTFLYMEFERGNKTPVMEERWA